MKRAKYRGQRIGRPACLIFEVNEPISARTKMASC